MLTRQFSGIPTSFVVPRQYRSPLVSTIHEIVSSLHLFTVATGSSLQSLQGSPVYGGLVICPAKVPVQLKKSKQLAFASTTSASVRPAIICAHARRTEEQSIAASGHWTPSDLEELGEL